MSVMYIVKLELFHNKQSVNLFVTRDRKIAEKFIEETLESSNYSGLCKYNMEEIREIENYNFEELKTI